MRKTKRTEYRDTRPGYLRELERDVRRDRARLLDRLADQELAIGRHGQAERLSHQAEAMREAGQ